ncbi:hypothetical protein [Leuconostoc rapi]|uniref:hypothetical protein n=1 Tax=Leuconostoc rapi TaxID=1406906 RepID=UPI00195B5B24|nr:hypothetical protein [Leuconostoc rapi]MBM7434942.1 hypothetical protein [Leuconostoc rapi]
MKLIDFENLTHCMSPKSLLFEQQGELVLPIAQIYFIQDSPNLRLVTGQKAMSLVQLSTRLKDMSGETQLFSSTLRPIFGFHLRLDEATPHIILK